MDLCQFVMFGEGTTRKGWKFQGASAWFDRVFEFVGARVVMFVSTIRTLLKMITWCLVGL